MKTGAAGTEYWVTTFQDYEACAGDIFRAEVYARQPSGYGWVSGSEAYLELEFQDAWHDPLGSTSSVSRITGAGQDWTLCEIGDTQAPFGTRYVRVKLVLRKPSGGSGESVCEFDDCLLQQGNSFNGDFTEDPAPPEGTKVFRSFCVGWSGWGIFFTNGTTNLNAYSNGYVKFWLKSHGYNWIGIQSTAGGETNKARGASYGPTTNQAGEVVWEYKVIPLQSFLSDNPDLQLSHIQSPFMITDPTYDHTYVVDEVKWSMSP